MGYITSITANKVTKHFFYQFCAIIQVFVTCNQISLPLIICNYYHLERVAKLKIRKNISYDIEDNVRFGKEGVTLTESAFILYNYGIYLAFSNEILTFPSSSYADRTQDP